MITRPFFEHVDEAEFTNRDGEMDFLHDLMERTADKRAPSYTIIARKGVGKTAWLIRAYNDMFCQQREVVPFYIDLGQFKGPNPTSLTIRGFMHYYLRNLLIQYMAFHLADGSIINDEWRYQDLQTLLEKNLDVIPAAKQATHYIEIGLQITLENYKSYLPAIVQFTRRLLGPNEFERAILFIDEFQVLTELYDEETGKRGDITEMFQKTAETRWCPMVVTSSAVSLVTKTTMGGLLARRFSAYHLQPFNQNHTLEYATKLAKLNRLYLNEGLSYLLYELTGGNPYYIWCLLNSISLAANNQPISTQEELRTLYEYELNTRNGKIRNFWDVHFDLTADLLNGSGDSLRILYHLAIQEKEETNVQDIAAYLGRDFVDVERILNNLEQADLVERSLSRLYERITDPVLADYIIQRYRTALEQDSMAGYLAKFRQDFDRKMGSMSRAIGHAAELFTLGLLDRFNGQAVDAQSCLGQAGIINLPRFTAIQNRSGIIIEGEHIEIDIVAESLESTWLVEVRHRQQPQGVSSVEIFAERAAQMQGVQVQDSKEQQAWFLSLSGFTEAAKERLEELGFYYSDRTGFNLLADIVEYIHFPPHEPPQMDRTRQSFL